jgi:hypothetical protein
VNKFTLIQEKQQKGLSLLEVFELQLFDIGNCNIMLNSVRQHNYFITLGNYIGYMFQLLISHLQAYFVN